MMRNIPQHVMISRSDNIGDVVLTLPLAAAIKKAWPNCRITVLARAYVNDVVAAHVAVDHFMDWARLDALPEQDAVSHLQAHHVDVILHVFPKRKIAKLAKAAGISQRVGTSRRWYHWLYCNKRINFSRKKSKLHEAQLNMLLLRALKLPSEYNLSELVPLIQLQPIALDDKWQQLLDSKRFTLVLHPLSHGHGREWPLQNFAKLAQALDADRFQIWVTGSAAEGQTLEGSDLLALQHVHSLCGKLSLGELLSLLNTVDGVVVGSTGPLHMAAACGTRTLGLFPKKTGVNARRWGPVGQHAQVITCRQVCEGCASSADCACMRLLQVNQVLKIIQQWQQKSHSDDNRL